MRSKLQEAVRNNDGEGIMEVQRLRKLIDSAGKKLRKANPYTKFMKQCMLTDEEIQGKKEAKDKFKRCTEQWNQLTPEEKEKFSTDQLTVYDYS